MVAGLAAEDSVVVPDKMLEGANINVVRDEVVRVDTAGKSVFVSGGTEFSFDKLFLATGSHAFVPPMEGSDLEGVMTLRGLEDAKKIKAYIEEKKPENIVLIGAGFISMELASLLAQPMTDQFHITVIELMDAPLPLMLDNDMADGVAAYLTEKGLNLLTGEKVEKLEGRNGKIEKVTLASGKQLDADMVFVNVGVRPNLELAQAIGLETGQFGILVN